MAGSKPSASKTQQKAIQSIRNTKQALDANDFDLAAESARELVERARQRHLHR